MNALTCEECARVRDLKVSQGAGQHFCAADTDDASVPLANRSPSLPLSFFSQQQTLTFTALSQSRRSILLALTSYSLRPAHSCENERDPVPTDVTSPAGYWAGARRLGTNGCAQR